MSQHRQADLGEFKVSQGKQSPFLDGSTPSALSPAHVCPLISPGLLPIF